MAPQPLLQRYVFLHWTFVFRFIAYGSSSNATTIPEMVTLMRNIFESLPEGQMYKITQREFDGRYFQVNKRNYCIILVEHILLLKHIMVLDITYDNIRLSFPQTNTTNN